jgi:integral membrane sensor domain MASE1
MSSADTCILFFLLIPPTSSFPFAINSGTRSACSSSFVVAQFHCKASVSTTVLSSTTAASASLPLRLALRHRFLFRRLRSSPAKFHRRELCCPTVSVVRFLVFEPSLCYPFLVLSSCPFRCTVRPTAGTLPSLSYLFVDPCVLEVPLEILSSFLLTATSKAILVSC